MLADPMTAAVQTGCEMSDVRTSTKTTGEEIGLSERSNLMPASPIRKLVPYAEEAVRRGVTVYRLNIGQPDVRTPPEFLAAVRSFAEPVLAYGHSQGHPDLLATFSRYYKQVGLDVPPEQIQITTGGSEAILFALTTIANPGDEAIVFEPYYTNYTGFAVTAGVKLVPLATDPKKGYHLPPIEKIEEKITERTKAILICSPNNPTGTLLSREEMAAVADLAKRRGLFVLSDEVYREFCYEEKHTSILEFEEIADRAILLDSISKRYSACGARVGCLVSRNPKIMDAALRMGQARLCSPTIEQIAAARVMGLPESYYTALTAEYRARRDAVVDRFNQIPGCFCHKPSGAFYFMGTFPVDDIEDFCEWMLTRFSYENQTVMMAPGPGFYASPGSGKNQARIAYVLEVDKLMQAMEVLKHGVEEYKETH